MNFSKPSRLFCMCLWILLLQDLFVFFLLLYFSLYSALHMIVCVLWIVVYYNSVCKSIA